MIKNILAISSVTIIALSGCATNSTAADKKQNNEPSQQLTSQVSSAPQNAAKTASPETVNNSNESDQTDDTKAIEKPSAAPETENTTSKDINSESNAQTTVKTQPDGNQSSQPENTSSEQDDGDLKDLPPAVTNTTAESPIKMMNNSVMVIQNLLEKRADQIENNPKDLKIIIDKYLVPNVDMNKVASMMLGPKWRTATQKQKQQFIDNFLVLLTNIYARNVAKVGRYKISFDSIPKSEWQDKKYVQVTGHIVNLNSNNQGSNMTVYIISTDNKWKIYDIAVEGVSIMKNYQSQFRPIDTMEQAIEGVKKVNARSKR